MAYSITQFQNNVTNQLSALDNTIATLSAAAPISCSIGGAGSALVLTPNAAGLVPSSTLSAYTQNMQFFGISPGANTGSITVAVGSLPALNVYKDTPAGPVLLSGNELIAACAATFLYDVSLNGGAGGFHLIASTAITGAAIAPSQVQINGGATLTNLLSGNSPTLTFTATPGWSSQDQTFTLTGQGNAIPAVGDFVAVNPPSLAAAGVVFAAQVLSVGSLSSVSSAATINIRLVNAASASLASNSGIYRWKAERTVL